MAPSGIHHLAIKARDPGGLSAFYRDVLGLIEVKRHQDDRGLRSVWFEIGSAILMIERSDTEGATERPFDADPPGLHVLALSIRPGDAPSWRAKATIIRETAFTLYIADVEGNRIGLSSYPEPLVP